MRVYRIFYPSALIFGLRIRLHIYQRGFWFHYIVNNRHGSNVCDVVGWTVERDGSERRVQCKICRSRTYGHWGRRLGDGDWNGRVARGIVGVERPPDAGGPKSCNEVEHGWEILWF